MNKSDHVNGVVYIIRFPNEKCYIGITVNSLNVRENGHRCAAKAGKTQIVYNALRKYKLVDESFCEAIDTASSVSELYEKEKDYIKKYNSYYRDGFGYNMTYGGDGNHGYIFTEQDKEAMSQAQKIRRQNPAEREKLAVQARTFWNGNEEAKEKMRQLKIEQCTDEWRTKQSEKLSAVHKENPHLAEEHGERMRKRFAENPDLGTEHSKRLKNLYQAKPELAQQNGQRLKKAYEDNPELRSHASERNKKTWEDPEYRKKMSEALKKQKRENPDSKINKNVPAKPFVVFKDKEVVGSYDYKFQCIEDIQKRFDTKLWSGNIHKLLEGEGKTSKGFTFKYKSKINDPLPNPELPSLVSQMLQKKWEDPEYRKKMSDASKKRFAKPNSKFKKNMSLKPFDVFKDGELVGSYDYKFQCIEDIQKRFEKSLESGNIIHSLDGKRKTVKGFTFKYKM